MGSKYTVTVPAKWLFILLGLLPALLKGQVVYHNYNSVNGLPSDEVYCAFQDTLGYMWFGTDHGLVRFNGSRFDVYGPANGLTDNTVFSIKKGPGTQMWCLTFAGGVCIYNNGKFSPHPMNDSLRAMFTRKLPNSWHIMPDGVMWLGMTGDGFSRVTNSRVQHFYSALPVRKNTDAILYEITLSDSACVFASITDGQLPDIKGKEVKAIRRDTIAHRYFTESSRNFEFFSDGAGNSLIAQWNVLGLATKVGKKYYAFPSNVQLVRMKQLDAEGIWLLAQNNKSYKIQITPQGLRFIDSLEAFTSATDVLTDRQGNTWFTTLENGIYVVPNIHIRTYPVLGVGNTPAKVMSLYGNGKALYAGLTQNRMLKIGQGKTPVILQMSKFSSDVTEMMEDEKGVVYTNGDVSGAVNDYIYMSDLYGMGKGLALGGGTGGFAITNGKRNVFHSRSVGFTRRVSAVGVLNDSLYIIGSMEGLYTYKPGDTHVKLSAHPVLKRARISDFEKAGKVYAVATRGNGVWVFNRDSTISLTEKDGLISDIVESIYFENESTMWVASYSGVSRVRIQPKGKTHIVNYTREDGLCSNQVNEVMYYNGEFWLATNEGLCHCRPTDLREDTLNIPLYIDGVSVNGKNYMRDSLVLQHNMNSLLIQYQALYMKPLRSIRYKIRLSEKDEWEYTGQNYTQLFNLPPGDYNFQVAAESPYGRYRSAVNKVHFVIRPHYTNTTWFTFMWVGALFLVTLSIGYVILQYERGKSENRFKILQAEFKALNYQINPHFVFNVLNSIQYFVLKKDSSKAVQFLNSFSLLIRKIVGNSRQQYISIIEEVECLREYLDLEKLRLEGDFTYEINIASDIDIERKCIPPMILQPLVENSIWHGIVPSQTAGVIKIDFLLQEGSVVCVVEDNGVGIDNVTKPRAATNNLSLALNNLKERLRIISELNKSEWKLQVEPCALTTPGKPGTRAIVKFPKLKL